MSEKKHVMTIAEMLEGIQADDAPVLPSDDITEEQPTQEQGDAMAEETPEEPGETSAEEEEAAPHEAPSEEESQQTFRTRPWIMPEPPEPSELSELSESEEMPTTYEQEEEVLITVPESAIEETTEVSVETDAEPATEEDRPVVLISHLYKKIAKKTVLNDINLALFNGHVLGLLGPNGSGKTTLLRILAGLAHPNAGRVEIDGITPGTETKSMVSYLPDTLFLGQEMTVEAARKYYETFFMDFDRDRFEELSERFQLPKGTKVGKMSKGYRDRLAVALVMSRRARLYLLDEPLGGVDPVVRDEILDILVEALGDEATMLITTHQVRDLERIFDEVCFLREGTIARYGVAEEIRQEEQADLDHVYRTIFG